MLDILLPRTDAGALVQLIVTIVVGAPVFILTLRRGVAEVSWFVGGLLLFVLAFYAFRTVH